MLGYTKERHKEVSQRCSRLVGMRALDIWSVNFWPEWTNLPLQRGVAISRSGSGWVGSIGRALLARGELTIGAVPGACQCERMHVSAEVSTHM